MSNRCNDQRKNNFFITPKNLISSLGKSTADKTNLKASNSTNRRRSVSVTKSKFTPKSCLKHPLSQSKSKSKSPANRSNKLITSNSFLKSCNKCNGNISERSNLKLSKIIQLEELPPDIKEKVRKLIWKLANEKEERILTQKKLNKFRKKNSELKVEINELKNGLRKALNIIEIMQESFPQNIQFASLINPNEMNKNNGIIKENSINLKGSSKTKNHLIENFQGEAENKILLSKNSIKKERILEKAKESTNEILNSIQKSIKKAKSSKKQKQNIDKENLQYKITDHKGKGNKDYSYKHLTDKTKITASNLNPKSNSQNNISELISEEINRKQNILKEKENRMKDSQINLSNRCESDLSVLAIEEKIKQEFLKLKK